LTHLGRKWAELEATTTTIQPEDHVAFLRALDAARAKARSTCSRHMRGRLKGTKRSLDVGADCWSSQPVTLNEIRRKLKTLPADPDLKNDYFAGQPTMERP
jgi:hypothetical protein